MLFHEGRAFVFLPSSKKPIDIALTPLKLTVYPSLVSIAITKQHGQKMPGKERVYLAYTF